MRNLRYFALLYLFYSLLSSLSIYINNVSISISSFIFALIASFFLRLEFKKLKSKIEYRIPYAGAYLMLLGYLGITVGLPVSFISQVHLLGLTLVLVGALFVDIGIITALVLGNLRLASLYKKEMLRVVAILFLLSLITSFITKIGSDILYIISSIFTLVVSA